MRAKRLIYLLSLVTISFYGVGQNTADEAAAKKLKKYSKYKLERTSNDSIILKKYLELYKHSGGELYIIMLQQKYKLIKSGDTVFDLHLAADDAAQEGEHPQWNDFLYCSIGKANGIINVIDADGNKIQQWHYRGEKKEGIVYWYDADNKVSNKFLYKDDLLIQK